MALLFNQIQPTAQIHILIIGVAGYPYLAGGTQEKEQKVDCAQRLGQLSSPQVSAEAFYNTVIELHQSGSWLTPLGSVDVILSPAPKAKSVFEGQMVENASIANIRNAYREWKNRCDSNVSNIAVFFFCGHGLDKAEHFLLADDFGCNSGYPWDGAFPFDLTRRGFYSCKAATQLFFIDACRQVTQEMLQLVDIPATPFDNPNMRSKMCPYNLTQKAAAANEGAYGTKNEPSFYTKALIGALKGNAATNETGKWRINTGTLSSKMNLFLANESQSEDYPQRCISETSNVVDIIEFSVAPNVILQLTCNPDKAHEAAELFCLNPDTELGQKRPPQTGCWETTVQAGIYKIGATFLDKSFNDISFHRNVTPPKFSEKLNCVL